jgi:hypothetical protein
MKNSKREITLNEMDSLCDMLETERALAHAYLDGLKDAESKHVRETLSTLLIKVCADVFVLIDLIESVREQSAVK